MIVGTHDRNAVGSGNSQVDRPATRRKLSEHVITEERQVRGCSGSAAVIDDSQVSCLRIGVRGTARATEAATALSTKMLLPVLSTRLIVLLPAFTMKTYLPTRVVQHGPA